MVEVKDRENWEEGRGGIYGNSLDYLLNFSVLFKPF